MIPPRWQQRLWEASHFWPSGVDGPGERKGTPWWAGQSTTVDRPGPARVVAWGAMAEEDVKSAIAAELQRARAARARGNEGQARVCARRAAGMAIRAGRSGVPGPLVPTSAYRLLCDYETDGAAPPILRAAAGRLSRRVTPAHLLPHLEDPIGDAVLLVEALVGTVEAPRRLNGRPEECDCQ
jgi:hypothetical protein